MKSAIERFVETMVILPEGAPVRLTYLDAMELWCEIDSLQSALDEPRPPKRAEPQLRLVSDFATRDPEGAT